MSHLDDFDLSAILGLEESLNQQSIAEFIASIRDRYSLTNSTYACPSLHTVNDAGPFILTSYNEDWIAHYKAENYHAIDPVYQIGLRSPAPVDWARLPRDNKKVRRLFAESADARNGRQGIAIPLHGIAHSGLFTVTADDTDAHWAMRRHELFRDMLHVAHYVHQRACDLHPQAAAVDLNVVTRREIEALSFAADGKSVAETAAAMRISTETVKCHLESARYKLRAVNRTHAAAKAIRAGLII